MTSLSLATPWGDSAYAACRATPSSASADDKGFLHAVTVECGEGEAVGAGLIRCKHDGRLGGLRCRGPADALLTALLIWVLSAWSVERDDGVRVDDAIGGTARREAPVWRRT